MSNWFKKVPLKKNSHLIKSDNIIDEEKFNSTIDLNAALASFKHHWHQAYQIMLSKNIPPGFNSSVNDNIIVSDDITSIVNHIDQMIALLSQENHGHVNDSNESSCDQVSSSSMISPLLDYLLMESILDKIFNWSCNIGEFTHIMKLEQLKFYGILSELLHQNILFQKPIICPLLHLLSTCGDCAPFEVEKRLASLLNKLCHTMNQNPNCLEFFFASNSQQDNNIVTTVNEVKFSPQLRSKLNFLNKPESQFLIFSLLIPFVHREGVIGQQARDGILLIMCLSRTNEHLAKYIVECTSVCPVLATGLSGLYSSLPRKLPNDCSLWNDWSQITDQDILKIPELSIFLGSLEFCNSVIKVSHPLVKKQLMEYVYQGFLVSVIGPALHQDTLYVPLEVLEISSKYSNTLEEIIATTAYLELCLRTISEPALLYVFLKFICLEKYDEQRILNTLISRIQANSKLCLITLALFETILDLNCEDFMQELIFKYLSTGKHLNEIGYQHIDETAELYESSKKFLSFLPVYPFPIAPNIEGSFNGFIHETDIDYALGCLDSSHSFINCYLKYLDDAHELIQQRINGTSHWTQKYNSSILNNSLNNSSSDSGIYSPKNCHQTSNAVNCIEPPIEANESDIIGPFLSNLLTRLSQMDMNDVYTNLKLTGLISKLALFDEPLLRSFLFIDYIRVKEVRSLYSILEDLRYRLEKKLSEVKMISKLYRQARYFFTAREVKFMNGNDKYTDSDDSMELKKNNIGSKNEDPKEVKRKRGIISFFFGGQQNSVNSENKSIPQTPFLEYSDSGYRYINRKYSDESSAKDRQNESRKLVLAMIIYEEFVKELSAIAQEHYILGESHAL